MHPGNGGRSQLKAVCSLHPGYGLEEESQICWKCANYVLRSRPESDHGGHSQEKYVGIAERSQDKNVAQGIRDGRDREIEEAAG